MARGPDLRPRKSGAQCAICTLWAGNSRGIPVHRYRLARSHYVMGQVTTKAVASIGLCDTCIREKGGQVRDYSDRRMIVRHRHPSLTSEVREWHMHAGFESQHTHPELGPEEGAERG